MRFTPEYVKDHTEEILEEIRRMDLGEVNLMEVCGTHTMEIAKAGIKRMLPENIRLLSGPGCPVCVTPPEVIDEILKLSERKDLIITTYGDMVRVPGSRRGDNLAYRKALGSRVEIVYSPMDAVAIAQSHPEKEVVFLGVGFETTAPGTLISVLEAKRLGLKNYSVLMMLKRVEPALRTLIHDPDFNVQGFLCPGHVAVIIGEEGFRFLSEEFHIPAVISGFEPEDILLSVYELLLQIKEGKAVLENEYTRAVSADGNLMALKVLEDSCDCEGSLWRGMGVIEESSYALKEEYALYDAAKRYHLTFTPKEDKSGCRCGEVIQGKREPKSCPLFGTVCTPDDPFGPCMVSSEGSCAAAYKYQEV